MSNSGFRGRGFGLRGARSNGPANSFNGPRFPHPGFNHPRPPRPPGPEKWMERPNFMLWQQNKNFLSHPQYRGNLQFRPNNRGRIASGRGIVRFSGPGRPPAPQYCVGFVRNPAPRASLLQEEQVDDKSAIVPHIPLLGSEEERQQKITETADKLKQKLSSITEEELTNFWEDDLSVLQNNGSVEENTQNKGIPELRHEPPELDLTFTDFKDIGRVDCNSSKLENTDDTFNNDEILITFEERPTDKVTNDEIIVIDENKEESLNTSNLVQDKDVLNQSNMLENSEYHTEIVHDLPNSKCNLENLNVPCNNVIEDLTCSNSNDTDEKSSDLKENLINLASIRLTDDLTTEKSSDLSKVKATSKSETIINDQDVFQVDFSKKRDSALIDTRDTTVHQIDNAETKLVNSEQNQNDVQTKVSQEETCQNLVNISDHSQKRSLNISPSSEEIHLDNVCRSKSSVCPSYTEVNKLNHDTRLNNSPVFQPRVFNIPPRFTPRIQGPRCRWTFQQNGKNLLSHGSQRLPFHGNRMTPPRHITPFQPNDLVPVMFGSRAPPPFAPVSSHDHQQNVPFSSKDLPLAFDPSEPPPNIRSNAVIEASIMQPHPNFHPRGPPPRISTNEQLPGFNPQHPAAKVHKRDETLQPPPIFDPRLSSRERSSLITPLDSSRSNIVPVNLMETTPISDFNIASNFPQLPSMNIPTHQPYISNVQTNFQPIVPQTNNGQVMMRDFPLLPPPINITNVPLPQLKEPSLEQTSSSSQCINMDDGLEDMQEAMEFAKQVMNMTKEVENENIPSVCSKLPLTPSEIPIPNEDVPNSSSLEEEYPRILKKQKKKENRNKKCKQNIICGPELNNQKQEDIKAMDEEQIPQNQNKNNDGTLLTQDQIRPKVVFNLSSKTKKIHKSEEWNRAPISNQQNKETYQQGVTQKCSTEKVMPKKCLENERNSTIQDENQQKEDNAKANLTDYIQTDQLNNTLCHQDHTKDLEISHPHYSNNLNTQKNQTSKKESKKVEAPTSESMWKSRVISRFLKMSKNDICNMVNNSSLRKFDIAMKHLVKEKRPSLSLEMRNTEDEKMKEYDREEFMNQLNAMLDPGAVVAITDLPTEFIHHLSEVLQLDPMPFDLELPETQNADQNDVSNINTTKRSNKGITESGEDNSLYNGEEFSHFSFSQENVKLLKSNKLNKKQQQPLFNEADLDDILSEVTDKTRKSTKQSMILSLVPEKSIKSCKSSSLMQPAIEPLERNTFLHISNKTAADLDDIFSAGIARVKSHGKSTDLDTFRSERYERWNRKDQDDPDSFRNLTKEEWEAKYGSINSTTGLTIPRKCSSNSVDNLRIETKNEERENYRTQRYCSSDSPMRHLSLSPTTREISLSSLCISESEEMRRVELSESNSDLSTTSSSDTDEEIVSPNVTKLLKVIKEKEKIAKKRSLNETIRDEVAAEIEKKWKEKSKYKERKSRKRERRKRDRKERRKRERKKRRSRNSYSDTSKSNEHMEEFQLLTENEIKKEVIVKEEPAIEKQQMSRVTCDITSSQNRNKPTVVSITVQPKTKAQLKQMPEFNNIQEKQIAVTKNNILNMESKSMKDQIEKRKNNETIKNNSERIDAVSPINNSFHQINVSVNITEPSTLIQPQIETVSNNNGMNTKLLMCSTSNPITEVNVSSQCIDQKIVATGTSALERKGNYKKIDIKAYKERVLQKRLKEQDTLKENSKNSVSFHKTLRHTSPIHATEIKTIELDESKKQFGDPQLDTTKPANIPTKENSKQEAKEKINLENKESLVSVQPNSVSGSRLDIEKNNTVLDDSVKVHKNDLKSSSQDTTVLLSTKLLPSTVDSAKFKNIRSEGGKELKLKKEKVKKSVEKKKKLLTREKQAEKCIDKNIEGAHIPAIISTSSTIQITETSVSLSETQTTHSETSSNADALVADSKPKEDNVCSMTAGTTGVSSTDDDNEQVTDQINEKISESSTNLKNKKDGIKINEVSVGTAEPVLPLCKELSVSLIPLEHTPQISIAKSITIGECETGTISPPDIVNKESLSSCERVDINIEKENVTPITTENNITSNIQDTQALKAVNENDNAKDNNESVLQLQAVEIASDYDKEQEDKSPCSPKSPFKGFREESIKENINRVSELYNLKVNDKSNEKNAEECSEQWLEPRLDSKSGSDQATDNESSKKRKKDSETSACNLIKPQSSTEGDTTDGIIHDNLNIIDNTEVGGKILETEDGNIIQEQNEQEKDISPMINTLSQDTFDENSEPFIVLDEYIDDADEKSIEKLNTLDLDLEDCVARDADIFTSQHLEEERCSTNSIKSSNFNSIDFKDLSEVLDKNNDREENQDHIISTEDKEKSQNSKSTNSIISTILTESPQDTETNTLHSNNMSLHDSVRSVTPKLSLRESRTIEDVHTINIPENNSQLNLKCFNVIRSRTTSAKSETSLKLNVPTKTTLRKSLENLSIVGTSLSETNVEFLKSNKETNSSEQKDSLVDKSISKTLSKSNQREENDALHNVKNKSKMKHKKRKKRDVSEKMIKEAVNSDVVEVKHPNTKETILARMIEIDVEIHKLMTEKMTLYQMLTNDTLPTENNLQQNNVVHENKVETPSVLMSHLIQNLEPSPVTNQCAKRSIETVSVKDITVNSVQSNVSKIPNKREHRAEKKGNCTSTCDSDEEEIINTEGKKSSTSNKKKKHRSERTTKKLENKLDSNVCVSDLRESIAEKRQANGIKSSSKKISAKQVTTEHKSSHNSINEIKSQEDSNGKPVQQINKEDSSSDTKVEIDLNKDGGKVVESTELSKDEENCSVKNNENTTEISNKKYIRLNSAIKPLEKKPLEKPLIYSDDSTWDSVLQNSSVRNQKKSNTGLALLEETYKKEMAKTRKIRVETRKKKKRKIHSVPEAVDNLTPEEEELSLSALRVKKLHKKKKLLNSRDQRLEETNTDQQLWRNVVEVINAVAENRAEQFHVEGSERQSSGDTGDIVPDVTDVERDSKSKSLEEREDNTNNDLNKDNLQSTLCYDEPIQQNLKNSVTSKSVSNLFETPIFNNMSEENMTEPVVQESLENNSIEIEDSNIENVHNINNISDVTKTVLYEEKADKVEELNLEKEDVNINTNPVTKELSDTLQMPVAEIPYNSKEDFNITVNKNKPNDSSVSQKKDDVNITSQEFNDMSQDEDIVNLKEQKDMQKVKVSNEENNNKNWASVSLHANSAETLKSGETSSKRPSKRKRGSSKPPVRRSSRYTEEITKHIKLETDLPYIDQELQDKQQMTLPGISHTLLSEKEAENTPSSTKKSKPQKFVLNRKKYRCEPPAVEILSEQSILTDKPVKEIKKRKQYTTKEMTSCEVRLADCKHTILNPDVSSDVLQRYGISKINSCTYFNSTQVDSVLNAMQLTSIKNLPSVCTKRKISMTECSQSESSKLNRSKSSQPFNNEINLINVEDDNAEHTNPDIDVMPTLTKEPVTLNISQDCENPDIEIVEEKKTSTTNQQYSNSESTLTVIDTNDDKELPRTQYTVHKGPILDIKVFENSFLAASEDGRIYRYNQASNGILNIYKGHKAAVTCLYVYKTTNTDISKEWMFSGSLDGTLRCYNITTGAQVRDTADIGSPVQCMDEAWGMIFIGTKSGHVSRYHIKLGVIKGDSIQFSDKSVLALKATNEGPRKVLIVASRSQPITIRDAQNGLFLRTICGQKSHTVYSLMRDNNLIYCGTSSTSIPVFDFTNGEQILQYDAGVGIVCMRLYRDLLFAGCYDGNIYVFNTKDHRLVCSIPGPGNMLLSMEIIDNKIIAGSKDKRLQSWQMPLQVRILL
ncbi:uncharacterized protein LOC117603114 [Osmia lignaria lignaria]|uniref:uncharacterized protein LOC117603114 n=1 Tax=Osmia lignaria lignaria TaxID=1437193 RepID=UPI00402B361E